MRKSTLNQTQARIHTQKKKEKILIKSINEEQARILDGIKKKSQKNKEETGMFVHVRYEASYYNE